MICNECETVAHCTKHGCIPKQPAPAQDPVQQVAATITISRRGAVKTIDNHFEDCVRDWPDGEYKLVLATPPAQPAVPLTARELELIDGMIEVQLDHAKRCDSIANRTMAERQKGWDMERVALLQKLKENT